MHFSIESITSFGKKNYFRNIFSSSIYLQEMNLTKGTIQKIRGIQGGGDNAMSQRLSLHFETLLEAFGSEKICVTARLAS
jgi:hypothetical protein